MKKLILIAACLAASAGSAHAQLPDEGFGGPVGYAPDKDSQCHEGDALNTFNQCCDGAVFAHDPCYQGPKNQFDKAACDMQNAARDAIDAPNKLSLKRAKRGIGRTSLTTATRCRPPTA